jgi:hypothetical protein
MASTIGPVHVVKGEHQARPRPVDQQGAHRAVGPEPLRARPRGAAPGEQLVEPLRRLGVGPVGYRLGRLGPVPVSERVDENLERQVALELGGVAAQHGHAAPCGLPRDLGEQPRFADARITGQRHGEAPARSHLVQRPGQAADLRRPPDKRGRAGERHRMLACYGYVNGKLLRRC